MKTLLLLFAIAGLGVNAFAGREQVAGMWNDGLDGENSGFYFSADGTGDYISLRPARISWGYDAPSKTISVTFPNGHVWRMIIDEKGDRLISEVKRSGDVDWIFLRQDAAAVERWLKIRNEN